MATQEERRQQTRGKLLAAGSSVLVEQGAAGFSTVAVAVAADSSNGAVFNHFNTRLELLAATVEFTLAELREEFGRAFSAAGADASAAELLTILWECMKQPEQEAVSEVFAQARTNPELAELLGPIVQEHHGFISEITRMFAPSGADIDPDFAQQFSFLFIYAMVGLSVNNIVGAGLGTHKELIDMGQHLFDASLDSDPRSTP